MLTQIDAVYEDELGPQALALPILGVTPKDSLLIRKVTGLNPPDQSLFIGDYARDGGIYQGRRVGTRNVVFIIDLNPNPAFGETVDGLRALLYKTFIDPLVDADYLQLILHFDDGTERYIVGYTEKFESEIFDVETMVQISFICPDPFIRDSEMTVLTHPTGWVTVPFTYRGTAETGFEVEIKITGSTPLLTLENNNRKMTFSHSFLANDIVNIGTIRGSRYATITRDGVVTSLLAALSPTSPWLELHSSNNTLKTYGILNTNIISVIKSLSYTAAYWGI